MEAATQHGVVAAFAGESRRDDAQLVGGVETGYLLPQVLHLPLPVHEIRLVQPYVVTSRAMRWGSAAAGTL